MLRVNSLKSRILSSSRLERFSKIHMLDVFEGIHLGWRGPHVFFKHNPLVANVPLKSLARKAWGSQRCGRLDLAQECLRCASDTLNVSRHAWGYLHPHGQALFLGLHKRSLSFKDKVSSELVASLLTRSCSWRSRISDCTCGYGHGCSWSKGFKHWHFQLLGIMFGE